MSQKILPISTAMPSPGGQTSGIANYQNGCGWAKGGQGVASRRPPSRATTRQPGGRAVRRATGPVKGWPRAAAWSG